MAADASTLFGDIAKQEVHSHIIEPPPTAIIHAAQQLQGQYAEHIIKAVQEASIMRTGQSAPKDYLHDFDHQIALQIAEQKASLMEIVSTQLQKMPEYAHNHLEAHQGELAQYTVKYPKVLEKYQNISQTRFETPADFISHIKHAAEKAAHKLGIDPKLIISQAALETGWGKYIVHNEAGQSSYNLFNIKARQKDKHAYHLTLEYIDNTYVKKIEPFKMYDNFEHSFEDYVKLISSRYKNAIKHKNPEHFAKKLQEGGYATDPHYAKKILNIYKGDLLNAAVEHKDKSRA